MRRVVILLFDPRPEPAIERVEVARVGLGERRQELGPDGPKPALLLAFRLGLKRSGVNEGHAQFRAHEREVPRAIRRRRCRRRGAWARRGADRALEDRQKGGDGFAAGEGGGRNDPRRVVEQRDEIGLVAPAVLSRTLGPCMTSLIQSSLARRRRSADGPCSSASPAARAISPWRLRNRCTVAGASTIVGGTSCCCRAVAISISDTEGRVRLLQRTELIGDGLGQRAGVPGVAPRARLERVEAAAPVGVEPVAHRLGGDVAARHCGGCRTRARPSPRSRRCKRAVAGRQMEQIGDEPIAKQRDGLLRRGDR
jgi:hypothetical protein